MENLAAFEANGFVIRVLPEGVDYKEESNSREFPFSSPDPSSIAGTTTSSSSTTANVRQ